MNTSNKPGLKVSARYCHLNASSEDQRAGDADERSLQEACTGSIRPSEVEDNDPSFRVDQRRLEVARSLILETDVG